MLPARHDDDDDIYIYIYKRKSGWLTVFKIRGFCHVAKDKSVI